MIHVNIDDIFDRFTLCFATPQGRRRVLKSGPAKTRSSAEGTRGGEHERGFPQGCSGDLPRENFDLLVLLKRSKAFSMRLCFPISPVSVDKKRLLFKYNMKNKLMSLKILI